LKVVIEVYCAVEFNKIFGGGSKSRLGKKQAEKLIK